MANPPGTVQPPPGTSSGGALSVAPSFIFTETTGRQREILLRGRALPYQAVGFGGKMRTQVTWYSGNPRATMQVLGPEWSATTLEGMWKDRFLPGQFDLTGFPELGTSKTADTLVRAFESLRSAGNELRVQWGSVVRLGVLTNFEPTWIRPQDVRWNMELTWFGAEVDTPRRVGTAPLPQEQMVKATIDHDDAFVVQPPQVSRDYRTRIGSLISTARSQAGRISDGIRQAQQVTTTPLSTVQSVVSAASSLQAEVDDEIGRLTNVPYEYVQTSDRVVDVLGCESWRRGTALRGAEQRTTATRVAQQFQSSVVPGALEVFLVQGETTLRQLSTRFYGSPDTWQLIADANGLVDSVVAAGTVLLIPPPPVAVLNAQSGR